jgi:hypothetical protein
MWEPVGPLPASVYWRRRLLAVASAVVAVLMVAWTLSAVLGGSREPDITATRTANTAVLNDPQQAPPSPAPVSTGPTAPTGSTAMAPPSRSTSPPSVPQPVVPSTPGAEGQPHPGASAEGVPATTSEELRPDETPRKPVAAATPVPVPSTGPVPCTNAMLTVGAEIDRPQHRVGEKPVLRLVITNSSAQPCVRDLDSARQEIVVWNRNQSAKLWSSNDCSNASSTDLRTLVPGQPVAFAVTWAGRTSTPGCAQPRTVVPAGSYRVLTRLDDIISPPTLFTLTP